MTQITVPFNDRTRGFSPSAGTTELDLDYPVMASAAGGTVDVGVFLRRDGVQTELVYPTHFTVTGIDTQSNAKIVLATPSLAGDYYVVDGQRTPARLTNHENHRSLSSTFLNDELNRQIILLQEARRNFGRALQRQPTALPGDGGWDAGGFGLVNLADGVGAQDAVTRAQLLEAIAGLGAPPAEALFAPGGTGQVLETVQTALRRMRYLAQYLSHADAIEAGAGGTLVIRADEALSVVVGPTGQFPTLHACWAAIKGWLIFGQLNILVQNGTYVLASTLVLQHPFGERIAIYGNVSDESLCVLRVDTAISAIYTGSGCNIGFMDGFYIHHTDPELAIECAGIMSDRGATYRTGMNMTIEGFDWNYFARRGGYLEVPGTIGRYALDCNYHALFGGVVDATYTLSEGAVGRPGSDGFGYGAEDGSIFADVSVAIGNRGGNYFALENGRIKAGYSQADGSIIGFGYGAATGGQVYAGNSTADGNAGYAVDVFDDESWVSGTVTNPGTPNTLGLFKPRLQEYISGGIVSTRIQSPDTNAHRYYEAKGNGAHLFVHNNATAFSLINGQAIFAVPLIAPPVTATAAQIADKNHAINTSGKFTDKEIKDTTNHRKMSASGPLPTDPWWVIDGSASVTPA